MKKISTLSDKQIELNLRGSKFPVELACKLERVIEITHAKATDIRKARKTSNYIYEINVSNGSWIIHSKREHGIHYYYDIWFRPIELNLRGSNFPVELGCKLERVIELTHAKATEISKARKKGLHTYEIDICNGAWIIHIKRQNGIHYCYDVWFRPMTLLKAA